MLLLAAALLPLCSAQTIPTPESVLGHKPGDDFYLANYQESRDYFHKLAAASNRIKLITVGKTTRGLDWEIAIISSPANLAKLDRNKQISQSLARGRGLDDAAAHALAREGKAIVHIDGGLHSTEVAGAQQSILLAYKLVSTQGDPEIDAILDNVILMLWPTLNPDGQEEVVSWYRKNLGTPYEISPLPDLYQEYVGHDNNRDGYMNNMLESRDVTKTELEWDPVVFYCHHQTAPFPTRIFIPPFTEPISSNIHPLMARWLNVLGIDMAAYLDEHGMPGAVHRVGFDNWYPGFLDFTHIFPQFDRVLHRDGALLLRRAALLLGQRFSAGPAGTAQRDLLFEPVERRMVEAGRCRALHAGRVDVRAGYRGQASRNAALQPLSGGAR